MQRQAKTIREPLIALSIQSPSHLLVLFDFVCATIDGELLAEVQLRHPAHCPSAGALAFSVAIFRHWGGSIWKKEERVKIAKLADDLIEGIEISETDLIASRSLN